MLGSNLLIAQNSMQKTTMYVHICQNSSSTKQNQIKKSLVKRWNLFNYPLHHKLCQNATSMTPSMIKNLSCICFNIYMITQLTHSHHLCHPATNMIVVVYGIMVIIYAISYHFHDYNHGWIIMILKDHVIMVIKFWNIKLNNNHGRCI